MAMAITCWDDVCGFTRVWQQAKTKSGCCKRLALRPALASVVPLSPPKTNDDVIDGRRIRAPWPARKRSRIWGNQKASVGSLSMSVHVCVQKCLNSSGHVGTRSCLLRCRRRRSAVSTESILLPRSAAAAAARLPSCRCFRKRTCSTTLLRCSVPPW
uniref:Uncharacterized protein n=1 Tax=Chlamydomonas euryale TaxID=1486919 RepID=A0A7R9VES7_9CHLO